jgi:phosphatidylglycerophosphate synthase
MSAPALQLVIDARPRGPRGPMAAEVVLGRPVLGHLLDHATSLASPGQSIAVHAREDEHPLLQGLVAEHGSDRFRLVAGPPQAGAAILRTDRFYDGRRLRWAMRTGQNLETAAIWRLDRPEALGAAEDELKRRLTYQPLGRFWAFSLAEKLAAVLELSAFRPNMLTLGAAGLMLAAAGIVAFGGPGLIHQFFTALALATALVLDTADGRLARLQGTASPFGRWLDHVLDELCDVALHAAIAWSMFRATNLPGWLAVGILYASGKYMFLVQSVAGEALEREAGSGVGGEPVGQTSGLRVRRQTRPRGSFRPSHALKRLVGMAGHADVRWHLWIVLGLFGRLDLALIAYAVYFPLRALGGGIGKAVAHA